VAASTLAKNQTREKLGLRTMPRKIADALASSDASISHPSRARVDETVRGGSTGRLQPSHNEIAEAAYQRYLNRGGAHGQDVDDWMEAERELRSQRASR
jgi:hypothetical protein